MKARPTVPRLLMDEPCWPQKYRPAETAVERRVPLGPIVRTVMLEKSSPSSMSQQPRDAVPFEALAPRAACSMKVRHPWVFVCP